MYLYYYSIHDYLIDMLSVTQYFGINKRSLTAIETHPSHTILYYFYTVVYNLYIYIIDNLTAIIK